MSVKFTGEGTTAALCYVSDKIFRSKVANKASRPRVEPATTLVKVQVAAKRTFKNTEPSWGSQYYY